jgi:hypothetical protein
MHIELTTIMRLLPQSVEQSDTKTSRSVGAKQQDLLSFPDRARASGFSDLSQDQHVGTGFSGSNHASAGMRMEEQY